MSAAAALGNQREGETLHKRVPKADRNSASLPDGYADWTAVYNRDKSKDVPPPKTQTHRERRGEMTVLTVGCDTGHKALCPVSRGEAERPLSVFAGSWPNKPAFTDHVTACKARLYFKF